MLQILVVAPRLLAIDPLVQIFVAHEGQHAHEPTDSLMRREIADEPSAHGVFANISAAGNDAVLATGSNGRIGQHLPVRRSIGHIHHALHADDDPFAETVHAVVSLLGHIQGWWKA